MTVSLYRGWACWSGETFLLRLFIFFFLSPIFCPHESSVTTGRIALKFGDLTIWIWRCTRGFQNGWLKGSQREVPISAKILSGRVLSNHWTDCSEIWGYDRYGYEVLQEDFRGCPRGNASPPSLYKRPNTSETVQTPALKPYIFLFLTIRQIQWQRPGACPTPSSSYKA